MDPTFAQVLTQLNITAQQLLLLMSNPQFPTATSGSGLSSGFATAAINAFAILWSAALSNGWKLPNSILPTANISAMAAAAPGLYYRGSSGDPMFLQGRNG